MRMVCDKTDAMGVMISVGARSLGSQGSVPHISDLIPPSQLHDLQRTEQRHYQLTEKFKVVSPFEPIRDLRAQFSFTRCRLIRRGEKETQNDHNVLVVFGSPPPPPCRHSFSSVPHSLQLGRRGVAAQDK
ncbi:hypothetical protein ACFE04_019561 [Oxalis oulophora]